MKKHLLKSLLALALVLVCGNVWGETKTVTFGLKSNPGEWPTENSTTLTNYTYTLDGVDYTFGLKNVKCNSGYLMLTETAALGLPAIENYKLTKVVAQNSSGCSTSVNVGVSSSSASASYIAGGAAQTWATKSSSYTYNLSGTSNNTVYYLYVTSMNAQITELTLTYEGSNTPVGPVDPTITTEDKSCVVGETVDVIEMFSSNSTGAITYSVVEANPEDYKLDGSEFLSEVAGTYTIKASQAAVDGKFNAGEATATPTVLGKYTVNYYSLGVKIGTEEVYDGQSVANAPEVTNAPTGWSFIDWTTNDAYKQSTTAPSFFGGVVTTDINLYAVFGKREGQICLTKMKADDSLSDGDNIVIVAHVDKADESGIKDYALYQETIKSSYVNKYPFVEDAELIAADEKNWLTVNMKADGFSLGDKKNGYIYSADNNLHCGETEQIWTISTTGKDQFKLQSKGRYLSYRYDLSTNNYWRMGGASLGQSGQTTLDIYKFVAGTFAYATTFAQSQNVTISNVGFATAFMGFDATVTGANAYYVTVSDDVASLTKVEGVIPANTGVVLEAQNGGATTATFTESVATVEDKAAAEGNMLVGSTVGKTFDDEGYTYYILSKGTGEKADAVGFYWDKNSDNGKKANCGANKAILAVPATGGAATSSISIRFDGATMIENIVEVENNIYYDLQGRKVKNPSNGLYIVNGKKMLVK